MILAKQWKNFIILFIFFYFLPVMIAFALAIFNYLYGSDPFSLSSSTLLYLLILNIFVIPIKFFIEVNLYRKYNKIYNFSKFFMRKKILTHIIFLIFILIDIIIVNIYTFANDIAISFHDFISVLITPILTLSLSITYLPIYWAIWIPPKPSKSSYPWS